MLSQNRNVDRLMKDVPVQIRNQFVALNQAGASEEEINKTFSIYSRALEEYRNTILEDGQFARELALNPIVAGAGPYTYPHLLVAIQRRIDAASTLDERELVRRQHYGRLSEYKHMNLDDLEVTIDSVSITLETPTWWDSFLRWFERKPKTTAKPAAVTYKPKQTAITDPQ